MQKREEKINTYRYLVGAYYGIQEMDEYDLKEYILKDINNYIEEYQRLNPIEDFDFIEEREKVKNELSLKTKLQDSLLVLPKINASMELILLVKKRIKLIDEESR